MILKIYKTERNHRQLRELTEEPEVFCVNKGTTEITRIPYKKHVLSDDDCLPPYLEKAERKVKHGSI